MKSTQVWQGPAEHLECRDPRTLLSLDHTAQCLEEGEEEDEQNEQEHGEEGGGEEGEQEEEKDEEEEIEEEGEAKDQEI